jgi:hypothetical protein
VVHLEQALVLVPEGQRSPYEHWYASTEDSPAALTPAEQLAKELTATRLQERMQRRFSRFFEAWAIAKTLPGEGQPGRDEALGRLKVIQEAEEKAGAIP